MNPETLQAVASVADSIGTLALALAFISYLMKKTSTLEQLIITDWQRQREKETEKSE